VTVSDVTGHAGVSRRTFYDQFGDKNDCFLAAFDAISGRLLRAVATGAGRAGTWPERVRGSLTAMLELLVAEPASARVALVEVLSAGRPALERRDALLDRLAGMLQPTDGPAPEVVVADPRLARAIVGGGYETLYQRLTGSDERLTGLMPDLLYCALVPYLGHEAALEQRAAALAAA
jgi:AcrR family transcriptional regulator